MNYTKEKRHTSARLPDGSDFCNLRPAFSEPNYCEQAIRRVGIVLGKLQENFDGKIDHLHSALNSIYFPDKPTFSRLICNKEKAPARIPNASQIFELRRAFGLDLNALADGPAKSVFWKTNKTEELLKLLNELTIALENSTDVQGTPNYTPNAVQRIGQTIADCGYTARELSNLLDMEYFPSEKTIQAFINQTRSKDPSAGQLFELRRLFGVDLNALADGVDNPHPSMWTRAELLTRIEVLTSELRSQIGF